MGLTCENEKGHLHPVHLNRGRHGNAWICLACGKQLSGPNFELNKEEFEVLKDYLRFLAQAGTNRRKARKEEKTMRLELSIMAGAESKAFLADLTKIVERMEKAAGKSPKASAATESDETETDDTEEEDDFATTKKTKGKKAASFDDDSEEEESEEEETDEEEEAPAKKTKGKKAAAFEEDEEEESEEEESEEDEEEEEEAPAKKTKAKKITVDDVNDACKARIQRLIKKGQPGPEARKSVEKLLEKKFGSKSISSIDPKQYAKAIEALQA